MDHRPRNAVPYGYETDGDPLYVSRARINNGVHPGKLLKSGKCAVVHGGAEEYFDRYEVLVSVVRPAKSAADRVGDSMFVPAK
ncbi:DM9 repeat-containing protein [Nitrogeniibacter aestuarii]|uniref:DM9 repeat-containing protein n=1 Tax=Nitrogeniibacter aestuarii TaxID=2815343 RepID=UPI001E416827|nr:DM9 repeat-containing protein [Nitrogeniibacter aestuarii]